jgi:hypothetical protein
MGALFAPPPAPAQRAPKPIRMPDMADPALKAAADRNRRLAMSRSGRASTILSRRSGEAGTVAYGNRTLGSAG